jgi:glycosyltransferase involved in cell wall biosynthesis
MMSPCRNPAGNPRVSIVIPVFNGSAYVGEAIESALAQTYSNREILVVNDGSTDSGRTREACLQYGERIRYVEKANGGGSTALNAAVQIMDGEYFSWLSHDDRYLPGKLTENLRAIRAAGDKYAIPFSNYEYIDRRSRLIKRVHLQERGNRCALYSVLMGNLNGLSLLIHRDCLREVGGFDETLPTIQDYDLFFRIALHFQFVFSNAILVQTRLHGAQQGRRKEALHLKSSDDFFERCLVEAARHGLRGVRGTECEAWYEIAWRQRRNGYVRATERAREFAERSFRGLQADRRARVLYCMRSSLVHPIWSATAAVYRKVRGL